MIIIPDDRLKSFICNIKTFTLYEQNVISYQPLSPLFRLYTRQRQKTLSATATATKGRNVEGAKDDNSNPHK